MVHSRIMNEARHNLGASHNIKNKARELRLNMTEQKKILWNYLRRRQLEEKYFRRQHPYGIYILDFYCFEANLVIEVDGLIHLNSKKYDQERTNYLKSSGLNIIRFKNTDIDNNIERVISEIRLFLKNDHP